jgi:hypothetical protein
MPVATWEGSTSPIVELELPCSENGDVLYNFRVDVSKFEGKVRSMSLCVGESVVCALVRSGDSYVPVYDNFAKPPSGIYACLLGVSNLHVRCDVEGSGRLTLQCDSSSLSALKKEELTRKTNVHTEYRDNKCKCNYLLYQGGSAAPAYVC